VSKLPCCWCSMVLTACSPLATLASQPCMRSTAAPLLAHMERQRAAGQLQLGSAMRASQLLLAAAFRGHERLLSHSVPHIEAYLAAAGGRLTLVKQRTSRTFLLQQSRTPAAAPQPACRRCSPAGCPSTYVQYLWRAAR
jgi:hypothetical protein